MTDEIKETKEIKEEVKEQKMKYKCEICGREMKAGYHAHLIKCKKEHGSMDKTEEPVKEQVKEPVKAPVKEEKELIKGPKKDEGDKQPAKGKGFLDEFLDEWIG